MTQWERRTGFVGPVDVDDRVEIAVPLVDRDHTDLSVVLSGVPPLDDPSGENPDRIGETETALGANLSVLRGMPIEIQTLQDVLIGIGVDERVRNRRIPWPNAVRICRKPSAGFLRRAGVGCRPCPPPRPSKIRRRSSA